MTLKKVNHIQNESTPYFDLNVEKYYYLVIEVLILQAN